MRKTNVGGQALIEGILMMGPDGAAIAVRKSDGEIVIDNRPLPPRLKISKVPVLRGIVSFFRQMVLGMKALMYSASFMDIESEEQTKPSKFDKFMEKVFGDKLMEAVTYFAVIISIVFSVGLFVLLPNFVAGILSFDTRTSTGVFLCNLTEGILRLLIFIGYMYFTTKMKEMNRIWEYHGAEHKTINCYLNEEELTIDNVKKYSTKNPKCGTSYIFLIIVVSIIAFSFLGWYGIILNIVVRILLIPLVAGVCMEILKFAGKSEGKFAKIINVPGMAFQRLTTSEPDDSQIEVAIEAFNAALNYKKPVEGSAA